jgi:hypothetical protein
MPRPPSLLIQDLIHIVRGQKVMLDRDLAKLYGVTTSHLNRAVKRNQSRFPGDFMLRLTKEEYTSLRSQIGILEKGQHSKFVPYAFTQEGVAMLSSVLKSERAVKVNIEIMRAFVRFRNAALLRRQLAERLDQLESHLYVHDKQIDSIFNAIRHLMDLPEKKKIKIGFNARRKTMV